MIVDHITVRETVALDASTGLRRTHDGYLVASPRVARTGIQVYRGSEVGRPDMDAVRVYRPQEEVFDKAAMATIAHRPVVNGHPSEAVNADNWRKHAVGQTGDDVARDGEFIRVPMIVMDGPTIRDVNDGKKELSLGYSANLEWRSGKTEDGQDYDAVQTTIRVNHLAIVDAARGGPKLVLGDRHADSINAATAVKTGDEDMSTEASKVLTKIVVVDGINCEMSDTAAQVVQRETQKLQDAIKVGSDKLVAATTDAAKAKDAHDAASAEAKKQIEAKDAEIVTLKKQVDDAKITPAKLDALVKDRGEVIAKAKAVIGDKLVVDGKSDDDVRKQVVTEKIGDASKDWTDDQVRASFATLTAGVDVTKTGAADQMVNAFRGGQVIDNKKAGAAHDAYVKRISGAWKGEQAAK